MYTIPCSSYSTDQLGVNNSFLSSKGKSNFIENYIFGDVYSVICSKAFRAFVGKRVTQKYTFFRPWLQLVLIIGPEKRKTGTAKDFEEFVFWQLVKQSLIRYFIFNC